MVSALNNLKVLPVKLQEVTNGVLKENFGVLRTAFTSGGEITENDSEKEGETPYEDFTEFWNGLEKFLCGFEESLEVILKNSKKIWTIECCSIEKSADLYGTKINELFPLYYGKLKMIVSQVFTKLEESKAKYVRNFLLKVKIFLVEKKL